WYGDKKRKIYEWDSQHGELEGYRACDGEHLGAFDPKTGKQV
ncbi:cytotoxic family protein, partial [Klebsiella pneumoniae]